MKVGQAFLVLALAAVLLAVAQQQAAGQSSTYIVALKEQPVHALAQTVGAPFRQELDDLQVRARELHQGSRPAGAVTLVEEERAAADADLSQAVREEMEGLQRSASEVLGAMRQAILDAAGPTIDRSQAPIIGAVQRASGEVLYRYRVVNALAVRMPGRLAAEIESRPDVAWVAADNLMQASLDVSAYAIGANTWWDNGQTGGIWNAGVVDSGLDRAHPAFIGQAIVEDWFLEAAGRPSWDRHPGDVNGHGTHVAGIISSDDIVYRGVAYGHNILYNLKAAYDQDGADGGPASMYWSDAMAAVDWAYTQPPGPYVLNLSYGGCASVGDTPFSRFWDAVVDDLVTSAALAAGNSGFTCLHDPSIAYNGLGVANVDDRGTRDRNDDLIYWSSGRGPAPDGRRKPDIAAPGAAISSANNTWDEGGGLWESYWGTSQAAPHVAGGLLLALDGNLYYPRQQKALLINTAQDRGVTDWDPDWGWGYMDLTHAYFHRGDVLPGTVNPYPDHDLYVGPVVAGDKATLVWDRHVDFAGPVYPPDTATHALSDLDLYLYNANNNLLMDASIRVSDNVEQVQAASSALGVLRVQAVSSTFDGVSFERYALATEENIRQASGPQLEAGSDQLFFLSPGQRMTVTVPVTNSGDLTLHAVQLSLVLPPGLVLVSGTNPTALGNLPAGNAASATWVLLKTSSQVLEVVPITVVGSGYGSSYSVQLTVRAVKPPALFVPIIHRQ